MAIAATVLTSNFSNTDASSYATASITPTANALILAAIVIRRDVGVGTVTLSGNGLTWVEIANETENNGTVNRLTLFRAMGASPSAGVVTITATSTANSACWIVQEFTGVEQSGTNGSGAVVAEVTAFGLGTAMSVSTTAPAAGNAMFGTFCSPAAITPGAQFTELADVAATTPTLRVQTQWDETGNDGTVDATAGNNSWCLVAAELQIAGTGHPAMRRLSMLPGRHPIGALGRRRGGGR